ncbi:MAG: NADH-quinone oxidoreductase subunit N, partial [Alphaproteobacteria bacterium]|nr:NADH-quinone oxidoreductase subunit N [Alphaproteobacteria bacterium]
MNWILALPELVLACCGMAILVIGVLNKRDMFQACSMLTVGAFLLTAVLVIAGPTGVGFSGMYTADAFSLFVKLMILAAAGLGVIVALDYNEHANMQRFEFPVLILYAATGMMLMASASNMMTMYVGVEL